MSKENEIKTDWAEQSNVNNLKNSNITKLGQAKHFLSISIRFKIRVVWRKRVSCCYQKYLHTVFHWNFWGKVYWYKYRNSWMYFEETIKKKKEGSFRGHFDIKWVCLRWLWSIRLMPEQKTIEVEVSLSVLLDFGWGHKANHNVSWTPSLAIAGVTLPDTNYWQLTYTEGP